MQQKAPEARTTVEQSNHSNPTCDRPEVCREKKMAGRTYMGTVRTTFVIDEQGTVTHIIDKVNNKDAAQQLLTLLQ